MKSFIQLACVCAALITPALAASPWDGTWKLDRDKSHFTGTSFTYSKGADGMWLMTAGQVKFSFKPDGKPYTIFDADHSSIATMDNDHQMTIVSQFKGKTASTDVETLSADGKTLTDVTNGTHADGSSYTNTEISRRSGEGTGFIGKWVSTKEDSSTQSQFTVSTDADGTMTWSFPMSKETVVGKPNGTPLAITGPRVPAGVTITYKKASASRMDYVVMLKDKKYGEGYDTLSADGKTLEDVSWSPGEVSEKTTAVYIKQ